MRYIFDADDLSNLQMAAGYIRAVRDRIKTDLHTLTAIDDLLDPIDNFVDCVEEELTKGIRP